MLFEKGNPNWPNLEAIKFLEAELRGKMQMLRALGTFSACFGASRP